MDVRRERMSGRLRGRAPARSGSGGRSGATRSRAASLGEVIKTFHTALEFTLFKLKYKINILWTIRSIFFMTQMSEASQPRPPPLQRQKTGESRKSRLSCAKIAPAKNDGVVANILRQEESKFLYYSWLPFKLVQMLMRISSVWLVMEFQSTFRGGADKFLSMWPNDWYQKQQIWEPKDSVHMLLIGKSLPPDSIAVLLTYIQFF